MRKVLGHVTEGKRFNFGKNWNRSLTMLGTPPKWLSLKTYLTFIEKTGLHLLSSKLVGVGLVATSSLLSERIVAWHKNYILLRDVEIENTC